MKFIQLGNGSRLSSQKSQGLAEQGQNASFFARGNQLAGIIAVADVIKEDSPRAVKNCRIWASGL